MQYIQRYLRGMAFARAMAIAAGSLMAMAAGTSFAVGTPVGTAVDNNVTMDYTVNTISQSTTATTQFVVDEKLVLDVTTLDGDWVTVVAGQTVDTGDTGVPAMNFRVTNVGNAATDVCVGVADQGLTQVTGFNPLGALLMGPTLVRVATDDNGNQAFDDDGSDTVLTPTNGVYDLGNLAADGFVDLVVSVNVPGGAAADEYIAYTLVAGLGSAAAPVDRDQSGNIAPNSGAAPDLAPNTIGGVERVFADLDAGVAAAEDIQFDFFLPGTGPIVTTDGDSNGQTSDSSGLVTGSTISLAKYVEVIYDPISGNRYDGAGAVIADPKAIPGAVMMYVIGLVNESAALNATGVNVSDDIPDVVPPATSELVAEGNRFAVAGINLPVSVSFPVGSVSPTFNVGNATNLDEIWVEDCTGAGASNAYNGFGVDLAADDAANPEFSLPVGACAPAESAFLVYFVTVNQ